MFKYWGTVLDTEEWRTRLPNCSHAPNGYCHIKSQTKHNTPLRANRIALYQMTKKVSFSNDLPIVIPCLSKSDDSIHISNEVLWHSDIDIQFARTNVSQAHMAVNDACGDIDAVDHITTLRTTVLKHQQALLTTLERTVQLAEISRKLSLPSVRMARFYAEVLALDIQEGTVLSSDDLKNLIYRILLQDNLLQDENESEDNVVKMHDDIKRCVKVPSSLSSIGSRLTNSDRVSSALLSEIPPIQQEFNQIQMQPNIPASMQQADGDRASHGDEESAKIQTKSFTFEQKTEVQMESVRYVPSASAIDANIVRTSPLSVALNIDENADSNDEEVFEPPRKKRRSGLVSEATENRCNLAHALISMARWEFRSFRIST